MAGEAVSSSLEALVSPGVQVVGLRCGGEQMNQGEVLKAAGSSVVVARDDLMESHGTQW